ncbi:hypothetical protein CYMTET_38686 [Cymbomonas tetramitiformis]|uniref:Uridine diphosphate glucose pyrophosphatase NUDT14 n=1 Tax=Cymbomonas tetramitiformis TaxID=36881 RepID=A0AAE0F6C4_9CHLO|nr:hypothetical protein CYMTET_38686 [Cymbomonas tetramitiformis]
MFGRLAKRSPLANRTLQSHPHNRRRSNLSYHRIAGRFSKQVEASGKPTFTARTYLAPAGSYIGKADKGYELVSLTGESVELDSSRLGSFEQQPLTTPSRFIQPRRINYTLDGTQQAWDMVQSFPSVAVALYHSDIDAAILVRQFRPAVYASKLIEEEAKGADGDSNLPYSAGFTYELCAGLADKEGCTVQEVAREEILEECGFDVPLYSVEKITSYVSAIGISGSRQSLFFAQVDETMRKGLGGGLAADGEAIQVMALPMDQVDAFIADEACPKSAGLMWGLLYLKSRRISNQV